MSKNKATKPFFSALSKSMENQKRLENSHYRGRHRFVPIEPVILALNLNNVSSTGWTDLDVSGYTSSGTDEISDDAFELVLYVVFNDTGSAANDTYILFRPNGSTYTHGAVNGNHRNNGEGRQQITIPLDDDYIFEYNVGASGANTADAKIYIIGYIEQIS